MYFGQINILKDKLILVIPIGKFELSYVLSLGLKLNETGKKSQKIPIPTMLNLASTCPKNIEYGLILKIIYASHPH